MSEEVVLSSQDMIDMVNDDLYAAIGVAISEFAEGKQITLSTVEVTLAAFLGHEVGESCINLDEIETNCQAYHFLMMSAAFGVHEHNQKKAMN